MRRLRVIAKSADTEFKFIREGRSHQIWTFGGERVYIPHREVNEHTARAILKEARKAAR